MWQASGNAKAVALITKISPAAWRHILLNTVNWRAGVNGYLGFRFLNANGVLNYGYARIRTTAPTGYPVQVIDFGVNLTGLPVTIPAP